MMKCIYFVISFLRVFAISLADNAKGMPKNLHAPAESTSFLVGNAVRSS